MFLNFQTYINIQWEQLSLFFVWYLLDTDLSVH